MAGHSKWHNIQHRKAGQDAKRGKIFTKLIREITVAAKMGGADINANPRLRTAVDKALTANMTKDTIQRAIKRGAGGDDGADMMSIRYEGYGPGGTAIMVDCLTDNKNRTVAEVRHAFTKYGGNLGTDGSVGYLFTESGIITFPKGSSEEKILEAALEAGANDIIHQDDGRIDVMTNKENLHTIKEALENIGLTAESAEITLLASTEVTLDEEQATTMLKLVDKLEELDDVQNVYSNADISEEILNKIA